MPSFFAFRAASFPLLIFLSSMFIGLLVPWAAEAQEIDHSFQMPQVLSNSNVTSMTKLPDHKVLLLGNFTQVSGSPKTRIAKLHPNGSLDHRFTADISNFRVDAVAGQPDGKVLLGGAVTQPDGQVKNVIIRLDDKGTPEPNFEIALEAADNGYFLSQVVVQEDGKILVGGSVKAKGTKYKGIIRFQPDGTLDPSLNFTLPEVPDVFPEFYIKALAVQPDQKIIVAGTVVEYDHPGVFRIHSNGNLDPGFTTSVLSGGVTSLLLQPDGKILMKGPFSLTETDYTYNLARLNTNGSLDNTFSPFREYSTNGQFSYIYAMELLPNGNIVVGGTLTYLNNVGINAPITQLLSDGQLDPAFTGAMFGKRVNSVLRLHNGQLLVAGELYKTKGNEPVQLLRLTKEGNEDAGFATELHHEASTNFVRQADGSLLLYGNFTKVGGVTRTGLARLLPTGALDQAFASVLESNASMMVNAVALQADHKILVAGNFTKVNGNTHKGLIRLKEDGTLDPTFNAGLNQGNSGGVNITSVVVLPDQQIVLFGVFDNLHGIKRPRFVKLHPTGAVNEAFHFAAGDARTVSQMFPAPGSTDKILVRGLLVFLDEMNKPSGSKNIFRLNADGSLDKTFLLDDQVFTAHTSMGLQADGKLLVTGKFQNTNVYHLYRYSAEGVLDTDFNVAVKDATEALTSVAALPDNSLLLGGYFRSVNGVSRTHLLKLSATGQIDPAFDANLSPEVFVNGIVYTPSQEIFLKKTNVLAATTTLQQIQKLTLQASPDPVFPAAPANLTTSTATPSQVTLAWTDLASDETGYEVQVAPSANGPFAVLVTLPAGATSFTHAGLHLPETFVYRVRARKGNLYSEYSNTASATVTALPAEQEKVQLQVFPNPNTGQFVVKLAGLKNHKVNMRLVSSSGQEVWHQELQVQGQQIQARILVPGLRPGVYVLQMETQNGPLRHRIVIQ